VLSSHEATDPIEPRRAKGKEAVRQIASSILDHRFSGTSGLAATLAIWLLIRRTVHSALGCVDSIPAPVCRKGPYETLVIGLAIVSVDSFFLGAHECWVPKCSQ
jgi:hypothetical protein